MQSQSSLFILLLIAALISSLGNALKILQVTDFHMDVDYSLSGDPKKLCHASPNRASRANPLGQYGDYMCDSPESLVKFALSEADRLTNPPSDPLDLILWTGDNVPHIDDYTYEYVVNTVTRASSLLFSAFPNTPILPTFGNHDYAPANAFVSDSELYTATFAVWKDRIAAGGADNEALFKSGGYYKYDFGRARILVLNTNLYYSYNDAYANFSDKLDPAGQFAYMEQQLEQAQKCAASGDAKCINKVHIVAHIPPGAFERTPKTTWFRPEYNKRFLEITARYASTIGWMIFGHHHTDTFHIVRDSAGNPVQLLLLAPSVTPWFSNLPGAGSNNPAFRLFDVDADQQYREITTYAINLDSLNSGKAPHFAPLYSFTLEYGLTEITPKSIADLVTRMESDDALFLRYVGYNSVMKDVKMPVEPYRSAQICSMKYASYPEYNSCLKSGTAGHAFFAVLIALACGFILF